MYTCISILYNGIMFASKLGGVNIGTSATKAKNKYNAANYERIPLNVPKGQKAALQEHVASTGESVNGFINRAIAETMQRDKGEK